MGIQRGQRPLGRGQIARRRRGACLRAADVDVAVELRVVEACLGVVGSVFRVRGLGFGVSVLGSRFWGLGFGVWGLEFEVLGLGFGIWGSGFEVLGLGFRVQGLDNRLWGIVFGVWGLGYRV